jgi:hypothetical protein
MSDPLRLLDDPDTSPLGRSLLSSATTDAPAADNRAAIAKRLGIAAGVLASTTAGNTGLAAAASALWWKIGLVVVALGGITALAVMRSTPDASPPPARTAPAAVQTASSANQTVSSANRTVPSADQTVPAANQTAAPAAPPPASAVETAPAAPPTSRTPPTPPRVKVDPRPAPVATTSAPEPEATTSAPPPAPAATPAPVAIDPRRLAAEVELLDKARAALAANDVAAALAALDEHRTGFADGALGAEADVLTIEALLQQGDRAAAADRARTFLTTFPRSPLTKRVRSLLARATKETP